MPFKQKLSKEIWYKNYKWETDKNVFDTFRRVAKYVASVEKDKESWEEKYYDLLSNFRYVPAGRIISNAGTNLKGTTFFNCFVDGFVGEDQDSINGIYTALKRQALILKSEGGYGFCANVMRPKGSYISGIGSRTPGSVSLLDLWDTSSKVITEGAMTPKEQEQKGKNNIRKGAQMCTLSVWHPDIEEFITAKQQPNRLTKFNMSVLIHDGFMEAVENNLPWNLEFPDTKYPIYKKEWDGNLYAWKDKGYPTLIYKTYSNANELWDLIMKSTYQRNEPGLIFIDRANYLNNLKNFGEVFDSTNPCITGDTLIALADGRGSVSIKQLAEEKKDVPVYCYNKSGGLTIRYLREPRITGRNQPVYKIYLDDGNIIRATNNHKFRLSNGEYKELKNLKQGDSLKILTKFKASIKELFPKSQNFSDYWWFTNTANYKCRTKSEHRLLAEFYYNIKLKSGMVVHHKDHNTLNNNPNNLEIMLKKDHDTLHSKNMIGNNNPMVRAKIEWSDKKWQEYRNKMSEKIKEDKNGRYSGYTNEDIKNHALELTKIKGRRFSTKEWKIYALKTGVPYNFSKWRLTAFNGIMGLSKWAALKLGFEYIDADLKTYKKYKEYIEQGYDCEIINNNCVIFIKKCEYCGNIFKTKCRVTAYCSMKCSSRGNFSKPEYVKKLRDSLNKTLKNKKEILRKNQAEVYLDLKFKENREILKKEWVLECKKRKIPSTINSRNAFKTYKELKEYTLFYNHRILKIVFDGYEDVYNGTVDEFHNFFIGGFKNFTRSNKQKEIYINTLQCGEQLLPRGSACNLGAINLTQFIKSDNSGFDLNQLEKDIPSIIRFQDAINDISNFPILDQKDNILQKRRIGIGYMGYGSSLFLLKKSYGSRDALEITEDMCKFVVNKIYQASAYLAKEKGTFPLYNKERYLQSNFIKQALTEETLTIIKKWGMRNSHCTTCAPTGTTAILANLVSGGIEPVISPSYIRTISEPMPPEDLELPKNINWNYKKYDGSQNWIWVKEGDEDLLKIEHKDIVYKIDKNRGLTKEEKIFDYATIKLGEDFYKDKEKMGKDFYGKGIEDLTLDDHIKTVSIFSKYVDASISKTLNLPNDFPFEEFKHIYMNTFKSGHIKGITTYRAGTMASVLSTESSSIKENDKIIPSKAPKRPRELPCDIHYTQIKGDRWVVLVGKLHNEPYEMFAGPAQDLKLPATGNIVKTKSRTYILECPEREPINILEVLKEHGTYSYSKMLAFGVPLFSIVDMCDKMIENVLGFNKAIGRILKKYLKAEEIRYMKCSSCGSKDIVFQESCLICKSCGTSKCG